MTYEFYEPIQKEWFPIQRINGRFVARSPQRTLSMIAIESLFALLDAKKIKYRKVAK